MNESFAQLIEESLNQRELRPGSIIKGTIVEIGPDWVTVSAGLKSDAIVSRDEFCNSEGELEVALGDELDFVILMLDDSYGETRLSRTKAKMAEAWTELERAYEASETVTGIISNKVKGGFTVEINKVRAFLPGSLVDVRPVRDPSYLEGKKLDFKVIKIDKRRNNVVVSRRSVVEEETTAERRTILEGLQEGQEVKGIVKNLTDYGAFVDLGGIDGLLHITDMSWKRVKHPSEIINVGDEILVKILKFDRDRNRVSLGLKQMGEDPWIDIARRYPENTKLTGKVTNITDYGCFVEIEDGVEGLVHVSEMDWTNKNVNPHKVVQVGVEVEVMVLEIDEERRRISLGIKQCVPNPWLQFAQTHQKDEIIVGKIKSITDFGIFIGLDGGIDGLVHLSDISWNAPGEEAVRDYKKGDEVKAVILAIDAERERISLGIKQLASDPFSNYIKEHPKGSVVSGTVSTVETKLVTVNLSERVVGHLRLVELSREKIDDAHDYCKEGDPVTAKIISVDKKNRVVNLSIKAKEIQEEAKAREEFEKVEDVSKTTLGDILKEQIEDNQDVTKNDSDTLQEKVEKENDQQQDDTESAQIESKEET